MTAWHRLPAATIAARVQSGAATAEAVVTAALARTAALNPALNAFTTILGERALQAARRLDAAILDGAEPGPLAGVPFAAKNLFDVAGIATLAGSAIEIAHPPATRDAFAVARLEAAGAICVGCLNMDPYAYGFTGENTEFGDTRNPHDRARSAGGSSSGSAAAVAAGLVPLSLGTDTNGSIRVPAALCGIFGLKPTFGRLSRGGVFPFVPSLDHVGPFARSVRDLALAYDALQGHDPSDPAQVERMPERVAARLEGGVAGLRIARLGGYFAHGGTPAVQQATDRVAAALGAGEAVFAEAAIARAAAFIVTAAEGAQTHLDELRRRPDSFDPLIRDRLLAGALTPAAWVLHAQRLLTRLRGVVAALLQDRDILVAPAVPSVAQTLGQEWLDLEGERVPLRPSFGVYTQPITCLGLPVLAVPVPQSEGALPSGVQLIAAPWNEAALFRAAAVLEEAGLCTAPLAPDLA